ncbi:MAG: efflux RND transporter periplasmic adaptor subunit [Planctomycetota bacterium]|jgi:multidrug efflux pump subunit AcrA (membrane-fusion protein)
MKADMMKDSKNIKCRNSRTGGAKILLLILVLLLAAGGAYFALGGGLLKTKDSDSKAGTYKVKRGDLTISVTENGDIKPLNSMDIKCEVYGSSTLISLVDEGRIITQEDVDNGLILFELDSAKAKEDLTEEEIKFLDSEADLTGAQEALDIQKKQNESDIEASRISVRFALMDLKKYLGELIALEVVSMAENTPKWQDKTAAFVYDPNLGGEALQMIRQLSSSISLTEAKLARADDKLEGTRELFKNDYVAEVELKGDELDVNSLQIQLEQDETALALYVKYEFPKEVVTLISANQEAKRELERTEAQARSMLTQAQAEFDKETKMYKLQVEELKQAQDQLKACVVRAPAPGEVVYATRTDSHRHSSSTETIEVGKQVYQRQKIISIPDTSKMKIGIKIHETWIDKIELGQRAKITVSAFPEDTFIGKVIRKAPMADPEYWLNPDLKVYSTEVSLELDGSNKSIKTGMTAKVEVVVEELKNILSVPIQAVINIQGEKVCYVATSSGPQRREVQTGVFNDDFVEIKRGLAEGEDVLLNPPRIIGAEDSEKKKPEKKKPGREGRRQGRKKMRDANAGKKRDS